MEKILQGIPTTTCYLDDVLITGRDDKEHLETLQKVLERFHQWGLCLKESKCSFMKNSVKYLGYIVDAEGLHTAPDKIDAIKNAPRLENLHQLSSFLGLVNYYGKFLPALSITTHPLNQLMQANQKWRWSEDCETTINNLKEQLCANPVLTHYDPTLPIKPVCDASQYGVGAVIAHLMLSGEEKQIAYGSRSLSKTEQNYAQVEKRH